MRIRLLTFIMIVLPALSSCKAISSFFTGDEVVAEVGTEKLYRSDLDAVIPRGTSPEDSTRLAVQYINTWASDLIYVSIAEQQLSKADRDVSAELEDYRKSLLKYRYEQLYVNERLDTAVSDENIQAYYEKHQDKFVLGRPLVKARYLRIHTDSPGLEPIRKKMGSSEVDDLVEADSLAFSAAMRFAAWNNEWIDVAVLAREFGMSYESMLGLMKDGWIRQDDTLGVTSLAYVSEMMKKGELAPIEYSAPQIRDMILSARKQNLITVLEQDLLDEARENGQFVIF